MKRKVNRVVFVLFMLLFITFFIKDKASTNYLYFYPTKVENIKYQRSLKETLYNKLKKTEEMTIYPNDSAGRVQKLANKTIVKKDNKFFEGSVVLKADFIEKLESLLNDLNLLKDEIRDIVEDSNELIKNSNNNYFVLNIETNPRKDFTKIVPKPDQLVEVTINIKPIKEKINLKEQHLKPIERVGFSVISVVNCFY